MGGFEFSNLKAGSAKVHRPNFSLGPTTCKQNELARNLQRCQGQRRRCDFSSTSSKSLTTLKTFIPWSRFCQKSNVFFLVTFCWPENSTGGVEKHLSPNLDKAQPSGSQTESTSFAWARNDTSDFWRNWGEIRRDKHFLENVSNFTTCTEDRLDRFYAAQLSDRADMDELWCAIRKVLILVGGNAAVESGFCINKYLMVQNLLEERSLIALIGSLF